MTKEYTQFIYEKTTVRILTKRHASTHKLPVAETGKRTLKQARVE